MKNTNLISSSEKLKLEITIQNQKLWKDLDNIFCMLVLDLLSKITEDKNELKKSASILLTDDLYMKKIDDYHKDNNSSLESVMKKTTDLYTSNKLNSN